MKMQGVTTLLGGLVLAASVATAQDFTTEGPFALRVKGRSANSSIDGILTSLPSVSTFSLLQYHPQSTTNTTTTTTTYATLPQLTDASHHFYYNYSSGVGVGFLLTDVDAPEGEFGYRGKSMSLQYSPATNVALPLLGNAVAGLAGFIAQSAFDAENKTYLIYGVDDAAIRAGGMRPEVRDRVAYNWAVCWQTYSDVFAPVLSWITTGKPHNPTCELVDLVKTSLDG
ncbi:hypothetical protein F4808DRAFT_436880 [Astrocystis sublimbata]|nr:hypothetical protein F4808DRAFT_436880 [Astrocystis sublimbata]